MIILRKIPNDRGDGYEVVTDADDDWITGVEINAAIDVLVGAGDFCSVEGPGCQARQTWPITAGKLTGFRPGFEVAEHVCHECGEPVCGACSEGALLDESLRCCRNCLVEAEL